MERLLIDGRETAHFSQKEKLITDVQSALDLMMTAKYDAGAYQLIVDKHCIAEDFFILSTGLAGEILQKYTNYDIRLGIYGDFSCYTSKPLHDFIFECNKGRRVCFVSTLEEAIEWMAK